MTVRAAEVAALAGLIVAAVTVVPATARADGAFPAAEGVIVPADRPQEIMLVTNFGIVQSADGGATWTWSCEQDTNALGVLYQLGPAPRRRLFAVANQHVVYSDDATCSWQIAGGLLANQTVTDVFPDPTDADHVLAIGSANTVYSVFESTDGGTTFGTMLYQAAAGVLISSVETARADSADVYLALMGTDQGPRLARTVNRGATWTVNDLTGDLGPGLPRIIAVDPADADTVLLRWSSTAGGEAVAVTYDGGTTATKTLSIPHYFTSFARMPDGALVMSAVSMVSPAQKSALFVSHDGALTFQENDAVPGVLAIAQRGDTLYAATDNYGDGYALGASADEGANFQPVVRFDQIGSIMGCLRTNAQCQASCEALAGNGVQSPGKIWDEMVCTGTTGAGGGTGAGGATGAGGNAMGAGGATGSGGAIGTGGATGKGGSHGGSGGGCALAPGQFSVDLGAAFLPAALLIIVRLRRRRGGRRRAAPSTGSGTSCPS